MIYIKQICVVNLLAVYILGNDFNKVKADESVRKTNRAVANIRGGPNSRITIIGTWISEETSPISKYFINGTAMNTICPGKENECFASEIMVPVCGSDNVTYLNPSVFKCAQKCNKSLIPMTFGICAKTNYSEAPDPHKRRKPPHISDPSRLKVYGVFKWMSDALGFHVHDDGGLYTRDEFAKTVLNESAKIENIIKT